MLDGLQNLKYIRIYPPELRALMSKLSELLLLQTHLKRLRSSIRIRIPSLLAGPQLLPIFVLGCSAPQTVAATKKLQELLLTVTLSEYRSGQELVNITVMRNRKTHAELVQGHKWLYWTYFLYLTRQLVLSIHQIIVTSRLIGLNLRTMVAVFLATRLRLLHVTGDGLSIMGHAILSTIMNAQFR